MKKLLLIVACVMVAFGSYAQGQLRFGVKAGANFSGLWDDGAKGSEGKFGYQGGLTAEYKFANGFAIAPEVMFTSQGYKVKAELLGEKHSACDYINYIAVPVMFKYYTSDNFSINLGPEFDFQVYNKLKGVDLSDAYKTFNFGIAVGASYYIDSNLYVDARYTMGVTNLMSNVDAKSYNVSLGLGYKF